MGEEGTGLLSEQPVKRQLLQFGIVTIGACLVALISGVPNTMNGLLINNIAREFGFESLKSFMSGLGVAGIFLSLPAGIVADKFGTHWACLGGGILSVIGYTVSSYVENEYLILVTYFICGLGCGSTWISALSTSVKLGKSWSIGLVSVSMSLSIAFINGVTHAYGCSNDELEPCWRGAFRLYAILTACAVAIGAPLMWYGRKLMLLPFESEGTRVRASSLGGHLTFLGGCRIFKKGMFWALFLSNLAGLSGGILFVGTASIVWDNYLGMTPEQASISTDPALSYVSYFFLAFSISNGTTNVLSPIFSSLLHRKGKLRLTRYIGFTLAAMSVHYLILGIFARVYGNPTDAGGSSVMRLVFGIAFGLSGLGYGMGLTLFPTALSECYGQRNWSVFMSYLQFGSAGLSLSLPPVATAIINSTGGTEGVFFLVSAIMCTGALLMTIPKPKLMTFGCELEDTSEQELTISPMQERVSPSSELVSSSEGRTLDMNIDPYEAAYDLSPDRR